MTEAGAKGGEGRRPRILHVSGDFPDPIRPAKTPVIRSLVDLTGQAFDHHVLSINRTSPSPLQLVRDVVSRTATVGDLQPFAHGEALAYRAAPRGIFHATYLRRLGDWIAEHIAAGQRPDLLVAHKLTIEGLAVAHAARITGIPYALVIQGNTDQAILNARPDLRAAFASVYHGAEVVFPFAPWADRVAQAKLGKRAGPVLMLPCPTELDDPVPPAPGDGSLLSVFHLRNYGIKNLAGMAEALKLAAGRGHPLALSIIGGGTEAEEAACAGIARGAPGIRFEGAMAGEALCSRLNAASGFVLPSRKESFGLVFVEALFAGLPIIYPAGAAVDGYFDGLPFALRVNARDPREIADAMIALVEREAELKTELAKWQQSAAAQAFRRPSIAARFRNGLDLALGRRV